MALVGYRFYGRNIRPYLYAPKKKPYTVLGMTLFSLVVFGAFAIRPSIATISRLRQEVKEAREAKSILDEKIHTLPQAQINYQLALEDLKLVDRALPETSAVPDILENLALAAGRNNVALKETEFGAAERYGVLETLPFTVTVAGDFAGVENFIADLESGLRQMNVGQVKMNRGGEELEQMIVEIEFVTHFWSKVE